MYNITNTVPNTNTAFIRYALAIPSTPVQTSLQMTLEADDWLRTFDVSACTVEWSLQPVAKGSGDGNHPLPRQFAIRSAGGNSSEMDFFTEPGD